MEYELAKQLRESGLPTNRKKVLLGRYEKVYKKSDTDILSADYEYVPTLSELIEACGEEFKDLSRDTSTDNAVWTCNSYRKPDDKSDYKFYDGESPEDAVANLWLELNKK